MKLSNNKKESLKVFFLAPGHKCYPDLPYAEPPPVQPGTVFSAQGRESAHRHGSHPGSATTHCDPQTAHFSLSLHHPHLLNGNLQVRQSHSNPTHTGQTYQQDQTLITSGLWGLGGSFSAL